MVTDPECHQLTYRLCCQQLTLAAIFSHANFYVLLTGVVLPTIYKTIQISLHKLQYYIFNFGIIFSVHMAPSY